MVKAVIFDLDGTLIDTAPDLARVLNQVLTEEGLDTLPLSEIRPLIGGGVRALLTRALEARARETGEAIFTRMEARFLEIYAAEPVRESRVFRGGMDVLQSLLRRGIKLGLCSNKRHDLTLKVLDGLNLTELFSGITGGRIAGMKPAPEPLYHVLAQLDAAAGEAVMMGDSRADIEAARNANLSGVIGVRWGYSREPIETLGADIIIEDFAQTETALASLAKARQK